MERLESGALIAASPRLDWAALLRRTFEADALECPKCTGRIRVIAIIDEPSAAAAILDELGLRTKFKTSRARDRTTLFGDDPEQVYDAG